METGVPALARVGVCWHYTLTTSQPAILLDVGWLGYRRRRPLHQAGGLLVTAPSNGSRCDRARGGR